MSRGYGWWGTPPLVVGGLGLLLLAFGAKGMQDDEDVNEPARQEAENFEKQLNLVDRREAVSYLQMEEESLKRRGKPVDLVSLAPKKGEELSPEAAAEARKRINDALSIHSDTAAALPQRVSFYIGLVLVFTAGVLLYRRTPASVRGAW